jgi:hypothetical protein
MSALKRQSREAVAIQSRAILVLVARNDRGTYTSTLLKP